MMIKCNMRMHSRHALRTYKASPGSPEQKPLLLSNLRQYCISHGV